ncbi:MAG: endopeptidase La [Lachnospiraceae bacterium]|nr:endopeptidase La [Lachnospiraceae bacterium]
MTVVPVYNMVLVPEANIYLKSDNYKNVTGRNPEVGERVILIAMKEYKTRDELTDQDFFPIGVSGEITEVNTANNYLVIRTKDRRNIDEVTVYPDHSLELTVTRRPDTDDLDPEEAKKHLEALKREMIQATAGEQWAGAVRTYVAQINSLNEAAAMMSPWVVESPEDKFKLLETDSKKERMDLEEKMIYENVEINRVNTEARNAQEEDYQKLYREQAIKKQMDYLQKELDDMHPEDVTDLQKFQKKIEESGMNPDARKEADKVLNRLKQEGQNSQESGMLYDYLDFVTSLSWKKEQAKEIDLDAARKILDEDHYGLKKVKDRIIQQIAVMNLKKEQSGSILLFVGAPGTGKTSIGKSIAKALGREYVRVSLGGVRDEADIRGHRRTYIGAMPGRIMDGIEKSGVSNPVMVLDEVDKLGQSYNGDPASALLEVLDPEQNNTFTDHYMNVPYDLSDVFFICTANTVETIPEPLLNRMEVIQFQGYTPSEKFQIAREHLIPKSLKAVGLKKEDIELTDQALTDVIDKYTLEAGVRGLKKRMDTIGRVAAVEHVKNPDKHIVVDSNNLRDFLDARPMTRNKVRDEAKPGVITGLAWTQVGGTILYIETLFTKGSGKVTITGQLGDVMKESAEIAISLVKSLYPDKAKLFEKNDLHIHVPDGSTPKDGPSAGITLTTALSSLVTGKPVTPHVAMTGEVSLQGGVNPIGGLPEKLMAAQRAGVTKVFIPKENVEDLRDVAQEVKDALEIVPVEKVTDVLTALNLTDDAKESKKEK